MLLVSVRDAADIQSAGPTRKVPVSVASERLNRRGWRKSGNGEGGLPITSLSFSQIAG